jgi:hypothetical protein
LIFWDVELFGERLGQHLTYILARAAPSVLLRTVQVPVRAVEFSTGAFLAAFLAALYVFEPEIASVAGFLAGFRPALFELLMSCLRALALDVGDHVRDFPKLRRVKPLQPLPRYPPRFHSVSPTTWFMYILPRSLTLLYIRNTGRAYHRWIRGVRNGTYLTNS